ncbi:MAG: hypothetical protein ACFE9I_13625 [Candidatus Hermodarchaeota archaeon]
MVQVLKKGKDFKNSIILEEIIILEEVPVEEQEQLEEPKEIEREKKPKKALLKLFEKVRYNAKYLQETKSIEDVKNKIYFRNHAVY